MLHYADLCQANPARGYAQRGRGSRATGGASARILRVGGVCPCQPAQLRGQARGVGGGAVGLRNSDDRGIRLVAGPVLRGGELGRGLRAGDVAFRRTAHRPLRLGRHRRRLLGGGGGLRSWSGVGVAGMVVLRHLRAGAGGVLQSFGTWHDYGHQQLVHSPPPHGHGVVWRDAGRRAGIAAAGGGPAHRQPGLALGVGLTGSVHHCHRHPAAAGADGPPPRGHGPGARPPLKYPPSGRDGKGGRRRRPHHNPPPEGERAGRLARHGLHGARGAANPRLLDTGLLLDGGVHGAGRGQPAPDGPLRRRGGDAGAGRTGRHRLRPGTDSRRDSLGGGGTTYAGAVHAGDFGAVGCGGCIRHRFHRHFALGHILRLHIRHGCGRAAYSVAAGMGRLLRPRPPGRHPRTDPAGANWRTGHRPGGIRLHVRHRRRLPGAFRHLRRGGGAGGATGAGRRAAATTGGEGTRETPLP